MLAHLCWVMLGGRSGGMEKEERSWAIALCVSSGGNRGRERRASGNRQGLFYSFSCVGDEGRGEEGIQIQFYSKTAAQKIRICGNCGRKTFC